jgi:hypothetical protein
MHCWLAVPPLTCYVEHVQVFIHNVAEQRQHTQRVQVISNPAAAAREGSTTQFRQAQELTRECICSETRH